MVDELARVRGAFEQPTLTLLHQKSAAVIIAIFRTSFGRDVRKAEPTRGVLDAVAHRDVRAPGERPSIPKVQVVTVAQLLAGQGPTMPATLLPYIAASRKQIAAPN